MTISIALPAIELNGQILFDRPNSIIVCTIVEIRDKAIKVDYAVEPVWAGSSGNNVVVFNYSCWIPKSVIITDKNGSLSVKKWFSNTFKGGHHIKKYYLENGQKQFV